MPTVNPFASSSHPMVDLTDGRRNPIRLPSRQHHSMSVLRQQATTQVSAHVIQLNVPYPCDAFRASTTHSQFHPHHCKMNQPTIDDTPFMPIVMSSMRVAGSFRAHRRMRNSMKSPVPTHHHALRRSTRNNAGHTTSARTTHTTKPDDKGHLPELNNGFRSTSQQVESPAKASQVDGVDFAGWPKLVFGRSVAQSDEKLRQSGNRFRTILLNVFCELIDFSAFFNTKYTMTTKGRKCEANWK